MTARKAADIADDTFLDAVDTVAAGRTADGWSVARHLDVHPKIALAKARRLIGRRVLDGCACGCRGDWQRRIEAPS